MSKLNCLLATAGAMLFSVGAHAGDIYEFADVVAIEHFSTTTEVSGVLVGGTQVVTVSMPELPDRCMSQTNTTQLNPGAFVLRFDVAWAYPGGGSAFQYIVSCKLTRTF